MLFRSSATDSEEGLCGGICAHESCFCLPTSNIDGLDFPCFRNQYRRLLRACPQQKSVGCEKQRICIISIVPSASRIWARFVRSADTCRCIEFMTDSGGLIFLISSNMQKQIVKIVSRGCKGRRIVHTSHDTGTPVLGSLVHGKGNLRIQRSTLLQGLV